MSRCDFYFFLTFWIGRDCRIITTIFLYFVVRLPKDGNNAITSAYTLNSNYPPESAVDGVYLTASLGDNKLCFETRTPNKAPWFQIEYHQTVLVHSIELYNRDDCCGERINNASVFIVKDGVRQYCGRTDADMSSRRYIKIICPQSLEGNIIRVERPPQNSVAICEIDINGAFILVRFVKHIYLSRRKFYEANYGAI